MPSCRNTFLNYAIGIIEVTSLRPVCDRYGYKPLLVLSSLLMFAGFEDWLLQIQQGSYHLRIDDRLGGGAINGATNAVVADISTQARR